MRLNSNSTAFTAFCTCNLQKCQETVLTKLTKLFIMRLTLSSAVALVEFAPSGSLDGVFFGRYLRDLFNNDLCPRVLRV
jgi:hypothetical protein